MTYGPIDFFALGFEGNKFRGEILQELLDLVEREIIRIIDLIVVLKDEDGEVEVVEMQQLDSDVLAVLDPLQIEVTGLLTEDDIIELAMELDNNTAAGLLLIENIWTIRTIEAMERADARFLMHDRIPHVVIQAAMDELEAMELEG